jgi:CheY-like chemotaxis protein
MAKKTSKVLLVDDSKFLRIMNERALVRAGYDVCTAGDGEEALRVANERLPDVIVLDLMLPKLSGPQVLQKLKERQETAAIPVIVLTSLSQKNEAKLKADGAAEFLEKSAIDLEKHPDRLATAVHKVLQRATAHR